MKKGQKLEPVLISSREGMQAVLAECARNKLKVASLTVDMELEINSVRERYQEDIDPLLRQIACQEAGLEVWSQKNRKTEFDGKKSIDLPVAEFGFRMTPPGCEKNTKKTWPEVALLLNSIELKDDTGAVIFRGSDYVKEGALSVDKDAVLRDRGKIPAEALELAGISIEQEELFFIKPKSEVLEESKKEAA